jgi:hypothetical protein
MQEQSSTSFKAIQQKPATNNINSLWLASIQIYQE